MTNLQKNGTTAYIRLITLRVCIRWHIQTRQQSLGGKSQVAFSGGLRHNLALQWPSVSQQWAPGISLLIAAISSAQFLSTSLLTVSLTHHKSLNHNVFWHLKGLLHDLHTQLTSIGLFLSHSCTFPFSCPSCDTSDLLLQSASACVLHLDTFGYNQYAYIQGST